MSSRQSSSGLYESFGVRDAGDAILMPFTIIPIEETIDGRYWVSAMLV